MNPKIDYALLGKAVEFYRAKGYTYVEVPWAVEYEYIAATLPDRFPRNIIAESRQNSNLDKIMPLVGSAEQGFLAINDTLAQGAYVGVTPCFRVEDKHDLFYQPWFMKVELYDTRQGADYLSLLSHASEFYHTLGVSAKVVPTFEGDDLYVEGVEVGSYGSREALGIKWNYGTGLALPRFSVARALQHVF